MTYQNYKKITYASRGQIPAIVRRLLPKGRKEGREYLAINPTRDDRNIGSFRINLCTGQWIDFATNDKGGDVVSLYAYIQHTSRLEALKAISEMVGRG